MNKLAFLFLSVLYVSVSILSFTDGVNLDTQILCCGVLIALFGIPHGSIDHVLVLNTSKVRPIKFYSQYISLMLAYLILWYLFPLLSFTLFMLLSAYHFGESQLSKYFDRYTTASKVIYTVWGINILSALIVFNNSEIHAIFSTHPELQTLSSIFHITANKVLLISSLIILMACGIISNQRKTIGREDFFKEAIVVVLIYIAFIVLPLLPAFTIYFVILHSIGVLLEEFEFLKNKLGHLTIIKFIKQLLPYTLLSIIGAAFLFTLKENGILNLSYVLLSLILISIVTLPHSIVMSRFYNAN